MTRIKVAKQIGVTITMVTCTDCWDTIDFPHPTGAQIKEARQHVKDTGHTVHVDKAVTDAWDRG